VRSGSDDDRTEMRDPPLASLDHLLIEVRRRRVPVDPGDIVETNLVQAMTRFAIDGHRNPPSQWGERFGSGGSPVGTNPRTQHWIDWPVAAKWQP
jgi:hypothetical protein